MTDTTDLAGATTPGEPNAHPANAGEFAARWNAMTPDQRERAWKSIAERLEHGERCPLVAPPGLGTLTTPGLLLVQEERIRQMTDEGYTPERDRGKAGDLATAGAAYAFGWGYHLQFPDLEGARQYIDKVPAGMWPWSWDFWKPGRSAKRGLVKAAALIVAAIDSLLDERGRRD